MEKRFLRFPTVKRTALSAETYVSHMKNVRFRCRKRRTSRRNRRKPYIGFLVPMQSTFYVKYQLSTGINLASLFFNSLYFNSPAKL